MNPDWVSAPGETLIDWLDENGIGWRKAAYALELDWRSFVALLHGYVEIRGGLLYRLSRLTKIPACFWAKREFNYRLGLLRAKRGEDDSE